MYDVVARGGGFHTVHVLLLHAYMYYMSVPTFYLPNSYYMCVRFVRV